MPMVTTPDNIQHSIAHQREVLVYRLAKPMEKLADACRKLLASREKLNSVLRKRLNKIQECKYVYVLNAEKLQISDNISRDETETADFGRDRSTCPYMLGVNNEHHFHLSQAYISLVGQRPSITAIQSVLGKDGKLLGFVCADFDVRDLPLAGGIFKEPRVWRQIKGDPSIREGVFYQTRIESELDRNIDTVLGVLEEIMSAHGVYHVMIHFSSNRAVIWHYDDPFRYHLLDVESLVNLDTCMAFPRRKYPKDAVAAKEQLGAILQGFKKLRFMDDTLYLRTGTLNIFNGVVGLTFSCDGSHYLSCEEFLDKEHAFWMSSLAPC
ncbi:MAG: PDC sensor domain-containing protein [Gammaproteobacteria bacterium]|nr:PDC sensor domain-containing protein [Gammaproteobacteria bacterium]